MAQTINRGLHMGVFLFEGDDGNDDEHFEVIPKPSFDFEIMSIGKCQYCTDASPKTCLQCMNAVGKAMAQTCDLLTMCLPQRARRNKVIDRVASYHQIIGMLECIDPVQGTTIEIEPIDPQTGRRSRGCGTWIEVRQQGGNTFRINYDTTGVSVLFNQDRFGSMARTLLKKKSLWEESAPLRRSDAA